MSDKNHVFISGNLTRDAELKYTSSGMAILKASIACNDSHKKDDGTWENIPSFFDITAFNKLAEKKNMSMVKGARVEIYGRLKQNRWEQDGQSRSKVEIIANEIDIVLRVKNGEAQEPRGTMNESDFPEEPAAPETPPKGNGLNKPTPEALAETLDDLPF